MTKENSKELGLRVLSGMAQYAKRAYELVSRLDIKREDFATNEQQAAFAALINAGAEHNAEELLTVVNGQLPMDDNKLDQFTNGMPSIGELEHYFRKFAEAIAREQMLREITALVANPSIDCDMLPAQIHKAAEDMERRQDTIHAALNGSAETDENDPDQSVALPAELCDAPGFIHLLVEYTLQTSHRPNRVLAFAGALALLSHLTARKFTDAHNTTTNLYIVALANSGVGKNHPREVNAAIGDRLKDFFHLGNELSSGPALEDDALIWPSWLYQMDEFDTVLNALKDPNQNSEAMLKYLLQFFSDANTVHKMRRKALTDKEREAEASGSPVKSRQFKVRRPSITILATAIPNCFYRSLSPRLLDNGMLARFLIFESGVRGERNSKDLDLPLPERIVQIAMSLANREGEAGWRDSPKLTFVKDAPDAAEAREYIESEEERLYKQCEKNHDAAGMSVWNRGTEIANKLALLYAISESIVDPTISAAGIKWGWKLYCYSAKRTLWMANTFVSDSKDEPLIQSVLDAIKDAGSKGIKRSDVTDNKGISADDMDKIERTLLYRDNIERCKGYKGATVYKFKKVKRGKGK